MTSAKEVASPWPFLALCEPEPEFYELLYTPSRVPEQLLPATIRASILLVEPLWKQRARFGYVLDGRALAIFAQLVTGELRAWRVSEAGDVAVLDPERAIGLYSN